MTGEPRADSREYPERPIVGVGAVIVEAGKVLLVKRRYEPLAGRWSIPGGTLELGETLEDGVAREMREETGLEIEVGPVIEVFDRKGVLPQALALRPLGEQRPGRVAKNGVGGHFSRTVRLQTILNGVSSKNDPRPHLTRARAQ